MSNELTNFDTGDLAIQDQDNADIFTGIAAHRFTEQEEHALRAPIPLADVDVKPTGEVFVGQIVIRRILLDAFGPGGWALRPMGSPLLKNNQVYQQFALFIRGRYISSAVGECEYHENNLRMSYGDALEGARSSALTRTTKDLGVAAQCWNRAFCEDFKHRYCETYRDPSSGKERWHKKLTRNPDDLADDDTRRALLADATRKLGAEAIAWLQRRMVELGIRKGSVTYGQCEQLRGRLDEVSDGSAVGSV